MSVQIRISYEHEQELQEIITLIESKIKRCRKAVKQGKYKRAYIEIE